MMKFIIFVILSFLIASVQAQPPIAVDIQPLIDLTAYLIDLISVGLIIISAISGLISGFIIQLD